LRVVRKRPPVATFTTGEERPGTSLPWLRELSRGVALLREHLELHEQGPATMRG